MSSILNKQPRYMPDLYLRGTFLPEFYKRKDFLIPIFGNRFSKENFREWMNLNITDEFFNFLNENGYIQFTKDTNSFYIMWKLKRYTTLKELEFQHEINCV